MARSPRSWPAQKPLPAPVSSTARAAGSPAIRSRASRSSRCIGSLRLLSLSGRFSVMVTTAPSGSTISVSLTTGPPSLGRVASVAGARASSQYRDGEAVAMGGERLVGALRSDRAVAVVGAGTMGAGIAQVAAAAGHPVLLHDVTEDAAERAIRAVAAALERRAAQGKLAAEASAAIVGRIRPCVDLSELAPAGLVVEAIVEELEAKRGLFRALEAVVGADAILATNTSSISVTAIGAALQRPGRLVGMHFFNPAPAMALIEVVSGEATERGAAEAVFATAAAW